jgi:hypothetical protein
MICEATTIYCLSQNIRTSEEYRQIVWSESLRIRGIRPYPLMVAVRWEFVLAIRQPSFAYQGEVIQKCSSVTAGWGSCPMPGVRFIQALRCQLSTTGSRATKAGRVNKKWRDSASTNGSYISRISASRSWRPCWSDSSNPAWRSEASNPGSEDASSRSEDG